MNKYFTDITVVLDRSGSMVGCKTDAEGGFNSFVKEQQKLPGKAVLTLVQFDDVYEFVHKAVPIQDVPEYELHPRGWTALFDAVGRAILETGERLKGMAEDDRPGLVVFLIVTDGKNNVSKEFTKEKVKEMIELQQKQYNWKFTYLGANQDAYETGGAIGIAQGAVANFAASNSEGAYAAASANVLRMRSASAGGQHVNCSYTDRELKAMAQEKDKK